MKRKPASPKLTLPQWRALVELSQAKSGLRFSGRGPLTAAASLAKLGLAERIGAYQKHGEDFRLTEAGRERAKAGP